jgi:hypothetical protein
VSRSGDALYAAGFFTGAGNVAANRIARWDGARWSPLGGGIIGANPNSTAVTTVAVGNSEVFAAGVFTNAGGVRASNIAGWLLPSGPWRPLGPGLNSQVQDLTIDGGITYAGGLFTSAGSVPVRRIGAWNGSSWSEVGGGVNSNVNAVVASPSGLYIGGRFTMAGSIPANRVARWDGMTWQPVGLGAENGVNGSVTAIAVNGSDVFVGGLFTLAGTTPAARIARWDGARWSPLGSGFAGGGINDLLFHNGLLYAAGSFTNADALGSRGIARWDGTNWSSLGSGLDFLPGVASAFSLAAFDDDLFVAGQFSGAGGKDSRFIARWNERMSFDPSLHLSSTHLGPQGLRVRVVANSIPRYVLEASTNFSAWLPLTTNSAPTLDYTDPQTPAVPHRFFRARGL